MKSVGIIGGADGPTAIFVSGSNGAFLFVLGILVVAAVVFLLIRHKKHK